MYRDNIAATVRHEAILDRILVVCLGTRQCSPHAAGIGQTVFVRCARHTHCSILYNTYIHLEFRSACVCWTAGVF